MSVKEIESMNLELIDLGDAAEETRQFHPAQVVIDSCCTWGNWFYIDE